MFWKTLSIHTTFARALFSNLWIHNLWIFYIQSKKCKRILGMLYIIMSNPACLVYSYICIVKLQNYPHENKYTRRLDLFWSYLNVYFDCFKFQDFYQSLWFQVYVNMRYFIRVEIMMMCQYIIIIIQACNNVKNQFLRYPNEIISHFRIA